ncbi:MAG: hypothetical protein K9K93_04100 [Acholeplasmataceae bacterium]|nr:hypothetical protein [Acholeplasmataceae bacterium]
MKKAMLFTLTLMLLFTAASFMTTYHVQANGEDPVVIRADRPHLLMDVGVAIPRASIVVRGDFQSFDLLEATLVSGHANLVIDQDHITASSVGVFEFEVTHPSFNETVHVIAKNVQDTSYVLYQEDFSGLADGMLPSSLTLRNQTGASGGSAAIDNERLFMSSNSIVLLPEYLSSFANVIIETDFRMASANNASRWASVMFRYETENYFQMAIRQDASTTNGVEFAKRIDGNWNVPKTTSYSEALDPSKTYRLKIDVLETTIKESIDDELMITYDAAFEYSHGRIGMQTDGVTAFFDNILITLPVDYIEEDRYDYQAVIDVYEPETGIIAPATTLVWYESATQYETLSADVRPATAIFRINADLDIVDPTGVVLHTLEEVLIKADGKTIPAFYTEDVTIAQALAETLKAWRIYDVFILSTKADVILAARGVHNIIRGVMVFETNQDVYTKEDLMNARREANSAQAVASLFPSKALTRDLVEYMQTRLMTVWVSAEASDVGRFEAVLSGANGIVTDDFEAIFDIYAAFDETTQIRRPLFIAHRGLYEGGAASPENTIESSLEAYRHGADIIELDVHMTIDLEVLVMHDTTTARTAPDHPSMTIASSRFDHLRELILHDPSDGDYQGIIIPTLREFLLAFKDTDAVIFIEIKPTHSMLVDLVRDIVNETDMYDQSVVITFSATNISSMNLSMPEMANGLLTGAVLNGQSVVTSLSNMFSSVVPINSTLNPSYGALTKDFAKAIVHRGITVWPWTIDAYQDLNKIYQWGVGGITTNQLSYFDNTFNRLHFNESSYTHVIGSDESLALKATISTQNGTTYPYMPKVMVVDDGGTGIVFDDKGNMTSVSKTGTAYVYTIFESTLPDGTPILLTTGLISIDVTEPGMSLTTILLIVFAGVAVAGAGTFGVIKIRNDKKRLGNDAS